MARQKATADAEEYSEADELKLNIEELQNQACAVLCTSRLPRVGDTVARLDGARVQMKDKEGNIKAWSLKEGESATVAEVDDEGDFRLINSRGLVSQWVYRHLYGYTASLVLCTSRLPVAGDVVARLDGALVVLKDKEGNEKAWILKKGEIATVAEVDDEGDFRLMNTHGLVSQWVYRKFYGYKASLVLCTSRLPVAGDVVARLDGAPVALKDKEDNKESWILKEAETATVEEVDSDADFRLRNIGGQVSQWVYRQFYGYIAFATLR